MRAEGSPTIVGEAASNLASRPLVSAVFALATAAVVVAAVLPRLRDDAGALADARRFVTTGGLTYELHAGLTSRAGTVPDHRCDEGWLNPDGLIGWSGGLSSPEQASPRGPVASPVSAFRASRGVLRRLGVRPGRDEVVVARAYAEEAGLSDGSVIEVDGRARRALVVTLPDELSQYSRSLLVPDRGFPAAGCIVGLHASVWDDPEAVLGATVPAELGDWGRRCVLCDGAGIADAIRSTRRGAAFWMAGPAGAALVGAMFVLIRRPELALYRVVGYRAWDVAALGATEATFLGSAALAIAACVVAIVGLDDLWLLGGFGVRYVAYAAATVGSLAAVTAFVAGFGARLRKVLGALRD